MPRRAPVTNATGFVPLAMAFLRPMLGARMREADGQRKGCSMPITGRARLFAIIGDPVGVVRSPEWWNAAFGRAGLDAVLLPVDVAGGDLAVAWRGLTRIRNLDGIVLTMPHKQAVVPLLDGLGPTARLAGAVNTVRRRADGGWEGEMFDGEGFVAGLRAAGHEPAGMRALQVGCGGAGRAIAFALARAGVASLALSDTAPGRAEALAGAVGGAFPNCAVATGLADPAGHDLIVNATPLGLRPGDALPLKQGRFSPGQVVADVILNPERTPLLDAAAAAGCDTVSGRAMFEGQARLAAAYLGLAGLGG
ncbi:shikimate dehydrogenase [Belnapia sp. T18]|uniref:Shikimate dehydrogenase n=1 Tax=Belnapia arida TaxID=2804533 RepID=A0ABS1TYC5_9PROT|nr:shikimate dehydrogenase [Belnapia arida]MBL6077443.1 shikimate dehydrogenase [Belnapia arida]